MYEHDKKGFYAVLEATPNSSSSELKRSYRKLALQHHPDREQDPGRRKHQHERMQALNEAYEALRDPDRKLEYDRDCGFPRCPRHPGRFLADHCTRCREPVCPHCAIMDAERQLCLSCRERVDRRHSTKDVVERALMALEDGDLDEAQAELKLALLANPRDVVALTALSTVREKRGDSKGAVLALRLAMQIKPGHSFSHYRLGMLYQRMGDLNQARAAFIEAVRLDPGSAKYRGALSMLDAASHGAEPSFRIHDRVAHDIFGSGIVMEVTPVGVRVAFGESGTRWLDPARAPMVRRA